ncbi:MAG: hemin uptake protein HemP [Chromatiales bacterium]|nr:hemin uptake protein HemP [Chromatiales bacterium]
MIDTSKPRRPAVDKAPAADTARRIQVDQLMGGARSVILEHAGCEYRLTQTRNGKLILTK